jgi:hypothetical protein
MSRPSNHLSKSTGHNLLLCSLISVTTISVETTDLYQEKKPTEKSMQTSKEGLCRIYVIQTGASPLVSARMEAYNYRTACEYLSRTISEYRGGTWTGLLPWAQMIRGPVD